MADINLSDAAEIVAQAEFAALKQLQAKAKAFRDDLNEIVAGLTFPVGYNSQPKSIAQGMIANLSYQIDTQLPQAIRQYEPQPTA